MKTKPTRRPAKKIEYWWFQGASVRELYDRLTAAGPDTAKLKVIPSGNQLLLDVVAEVSTQSHDPRHINDSHACPPDCG